eukprot:44551-Amorphochlora_amoeboformis.AAC.1
MNLPFEKSARESDVSTITENHALKAINTLKVDPYWYPNKQANKRISKQTNKQTNEQANKRANKQANKRTSKQTNKRTNEQANKQTSKQTNKRTNEQANKQTSSSSLYKRKLSEFVRTFNNSKESLKKALKKR